MSEIKILPCPFCGSQPDIAPWHGGGAEKHMVSCGEEECEANPEVTGENRTEAVAAWNRRAALASAAVAEREPYGYVDEKAGCFYADHTPNTDGLTAVYLDPPPTSELEAENARLKEARHFWKTEYLNASADAAKFANDLVRAEAQRDEALKALEPFAAIEWADEDGWSHDSPYRERVCDWFGPSDFRTARRVREGGKVE